MNILSVHLSLISYAPHFKIPGYATTGNNTEKDLDIAPVYGIQHELYTVDRLTLSGPYLTFYFPMANSRRFCSTRGDV